MPYDLARLGWLQFQRLCDLVLEEGAGLPARAWLGDADHRREAVSDAPVEVGEVALTPPVAVAARFLRREVAAASVVPLLVNAVTSRGPGEAPDLSVLVMTNTRLTDVGRARLRETLTGDPAAARVDVLDGERLGALVDALPAVRRALPSLLGLRELDGWLDPAVVERSSLDLGGAAALARVFVATRTHAAALAALDRHGFAVLTGLPEMGKTAIARMIALAQLSVGWEAHECLDPGEVRRAFDPARPQVFVADDAFGSTEYRPDGAERWARALPELLPLFDDRHWLLWTSRPVPLRAGLARVRREEGFERFPSPVEVTVDADDLDADERALILLRHAGAAELPASARRLVTGQGPAMVAHPQFTPERIRRLVAGLPRGSLLSGVGGERAVAAAVRAALAVPSDGMRGSFSALGDEQRALLQAMLDRPPGPVPERELAVGLRSLRPGAHGDPHALLASLEEHFLRLHHGRAEWVHPSWRDVVIDDLAARADERRAFLTACGVEGVALALSTGGGPAGARRLPLLRADADWDALGDRLGPLVRELDDDGLERLLRLLGDTAQRLVGEAALRELGALAGRALRLASRRWTGQVVPVDALAAWWALAREFPPPPPAPDPGPTWAELDPVRVPERGRPEDLDRLDTWLALAAVLSEHDPAALAAFGFPERRRDVLDATRELIAAESLTGPAAQLARIRDGIDRLVRGVARSTLDIPEEEIAPRPAEPEPVAPPGRIERILADLG